MSKFTSREFILAFVAAMAGVVKLFVDVDDDLVAQIGAVIVIIVSVAAYAWARTSQKKSQV
jgi:membrane protein DedA with SNARE-associated domain